MRVLLCLFVFQCFIGCASAPLPPPQVLDIPQTTFSPDDWALEKLKGIGFDLKNVPVNKIPLQTAERIVQLNVLGFLYQADYSLNDTPEALQKSARFLKRYRKTFARAEKNYQVSKEAIVSLLWVETKLGKRVGKYSLIQVYFTLLKADHPSFIQSTLKALGAKKPQPEFALQKKCVDRSKSKAAWALEQMQAVHQIIYGKDTTYLAAAMKRSPSKKSAWILATPASYAGAFGLPQFIPSSYLSYAMSPADGSAPQLYHAEDAILSVANFLHEKGWKNETELDQTKALFEYNRSKDYGAIIIKIAKKLQDQAPKTVSTAHPAPSP